MILRFALATALPLLLACPLHLQAEQGLAVLKVNLRERPDLRSRIVGVLEKGAPTRVIEHLGQSEFVKVQRLSDGLEGFLRLRNLELHPEPQSAEPSTRSTSLSPRNAATFYARQPTALRRTPAADGPIVSLLKADDPVVLLAHHGTYARIKRNRDGQTGYVPVGALILRQSSSGVLAPSPHEFE